MAERIMSEEHKAAIAAGRIEAAAVRDYLDALETNRPKRGRQVSPETLAPARKADIDGQLGSGDMKPIKKLEMLQDRRDIDAQLAEFQTEPDMGAVEAGFVTHARHVRSTQRNRLRHMARIRRTRRAARQGRDQQRAVGKRQYIGAQRNLEETPPARALRFADIESARDRSEPCLRKIAWIWFEICTRNTHYL